MLLLGSKHFHIKRSSVTYVVDPLFQHLKVAYSTVLKDEMFICVLPPILHFFVCFVFLYVPPHFCFTQPK